jgi:hypothetical protein
MIHNTWHGERSMKRRSTDPNKKEVLKIAILFIVLSLALLYLILFTPSCENKPGWDAGVNDYEISSVDSILICIDWAKSGKPIVAHDIQITEVEPGMFAPQDVAVIFTVQVDTVDKAFLDSIYHQVDWEGKDD